ncbi:hypothetical protein [Streptomyces sp. SM12]|uniref:hypothetical protein n=1 Tax=Streptomyces sp. SM12 TaxID=1071602 RepID=UPI0011B09EDE|nr:hypothetical protein [Streptomyces sp. SM12]
MISDADYFRVSGQVRTRVMQFARDYFTSLGRWRQEDMDAFVARIVPVVAAGQRQMATLTDLYLAGQLAAMHGSAPEPGRIDLDEVTGAATRNGADPSDVYRRPFVELYTALAAGVQLSDAVERAANRLDSLTGTDMQLAKTHAARAAMERSDAQFYRRVLVGAKNCALCVVASTQRYRRSMLMPIHPGCNCAIAPVQGNARHVLNKAQLEEIHGAVEAFAGREARDAREVDYSEIIVIQDHGEYGPTLAYRGQEFTGPQDLN